jgi:hypothetical protein
MYEKLCYPNTPDTSSLDAARPDKEQFQGDFVKLVFGFDFSAYQRIFRKTTGVELGGIRIESDEIYLKDGNAFAIMKPLINGEPIKIISDYLGTTTRRDSNTAHGQGNRQA